MCVAMKYLYVPLEIKADLFQLEGSQMGRLASTDDTVVILADDLIYFI